MKIQELIDKVKAVIYPNGVRAVEAEKHQALIIELLHAIEDEFNKRTPEEQGAVGDVLVKGLDGINEWVDTHADKLKVVELEQRIKDLQNSVGQLNSGDSFAVEGGSVIDLPANVLDAVADVKVQGVTATNALNNSGFSNDLDGWVVRYVDLIDNTDGVLTVKLKELAAANRIETYPSNFAAVVGHVYYVVGAIKVRGKSQVFIQTGLHDTVASDAVYSDDGWAEIKGIVTAKTEAAFRLYAPTNNGEYEVGDTMKYKEPMCIDLTATFGAGNEPTKEQCDLMFPYWFDGTKSVTTPMRVRSFRGRINIVKNSNIPQSYEVAASPGDGLELITPKAYILERSLTPNKPHTTSMLLSGKGTLKPSVIGLNILATFRVDSAEPVWMSVSTNMDYSQAEYIHLYTDKENGFTGTIHKFKVEEGSVGTPWTPALSDLYVNEHTSNFYVKNSLQLESVGATSDFIKEGKLYKSIKDGEVVDTEITPIHTSGQVVAHPNGTILFEPVVSLIRKYAGEIAVDADLPLKKLDSISTIDYVTGVETVLDVSKAVISGNSFTHPNIQDGDLVAFEYLYDESPIYGLNEAECYNSDKVLKDTVTNDLYKVVETVDNGVLTRKVEKL